MRYLCGEKGADGSIPSRDGCTPVHTASGEGHLHVIKYLIEECGCNASTPSEDGVTSVFAASVSGHLRYLVGERKCDASQETSTTPLCTPQPSEASWT